MRRSRRALVAVGVLLAGSIPWHALRPYLLRELARSSIGCPVRSSLLEAASLAQLAPAVVDGSTRVSASFAVPNRVIVTRKLEGTRASELEAVGWTFVCAITLLDDQLTPLGQVRLISGYPVPQAGDWDGDGVIEVLLSYKAFRPGVARTARVSGWAVLRIGKSANEVVGLVLLDDSPWQQQRARVWPAWRDADEDGAAELAFTTYSVRQRPSGLWEQVFGPDVAVLAWDEPGGVLRPIKLPGDGSFLVWTPPDGEPYLFSPDELADLVFRELLPMPEGFGVPTASQPGSQPDTQPAIP